MDTAKKNFCSLYSFISVLISLSRTSSTKVKNNNESGNLGNISKVSKTMFSIGFYEIDLVKDFFCIVELIICFFFFGPLIMNYIARSSFVQIPPSFWGKS